MENILKSAKFGDRFRTRDGRIAIYVKNYKHGEYLHECLVDSEEGAYNVLYNKCGRIYEHESDDDIVGKWD